MPLFEVEHTIHLSPLQLDKLAEGITRIHTLAFTTPSLFVNVRFTNVAQQVTYVGGKPKRTNRIIAYIRNGGGRSNKQFEKICRELEEEWNKVIQHEGPEYKLRAVFILPTITAGMEAGFILPQAGEDIAWMKTHRNEFQKLAGEKESEGDPEFKELMREMQERDDLKAELGDQAGTSGTRAAVPAHSHEPEAETSHDGHTPEQFTKIAKRDGDTPVGGVSESAQQDTTTTKHHDTHEGGSRERDLSQQSAVPQPEVVPQQDANLPQGQPLPVGGQPLQEGEILQDHPYLKYYIHDLDNPADPTRTLPTGQAPPAQYSQPGSHPTQHDQRAQSTQASPSDPPSGHASEREADHPNRRTDAGTEIGETARDRTMGPQSGAAEAARGQAMLAKTDGPSDGGAPGPFTGA